MKGNLICVSIYFVIWRKEKVSKIAKALNKKSVHLRIISGWLQGNIGSKWSVKLPKS